MIHMTKKLLQNSHFGFQGYTVLLSKMKELPQSACNSAKSAKETPEQGMKSVHK